MSTYQSWLDRIDLSIAVMDDLGYPDTITMRLNRRELVELKMIVSTCKQLAEEKAKEYKS